MITYTEDITIPCFFAGNHPKQKLVEACNRLVPEQGPSDHPLIENFRVASNAYYDFLNNGRAKDFAKIFGFSSRKYDDINVVVRLMDAVIWNMAQSVGNFHGLRMPEWVELHELISRQNEKKKFRVHAKSQTKSDSVIDGLPGQIYFRWTKNGNQWNGGALWPYQAAALVEVLNRELARNLQDQESENINKYFDSIKEQSDTETD